MLLLVEYVLDLDEIQNQYKLLRVITGMRGSAGNDIDVPLPPDFKFDDSIGNDENIIPRIIEKIKYIFENFQSEHDRQNPYREEVLQDPQVFFNNVTKIFRGNLK